MTEHIERTKLVAFMLSESKLKEEEDRHLSHCKECHQAMVEATLAHLAKPTTEADSS